MAKWDKPKQRRYSCGANAIRIISVAWSGITAFTLMVAGFSRDPEIFDAARTWPLFMFFGTLSTFFALVLSWKPWGDAARWMPRVVTVLGWQTAAGAVIAFTMAALVHDARNLVYGFIGLYFLANALPFMGLRLIDIALHRIEAEQNTSEERPATELKAPSTNRPQPRPSAHHPQTEPGPTPAVTPDAETGSVSTHPIVPPRSDLLFRHIFTDDNNGDLLRSLLCSVLPDLPTAEWAKVRLSDPRIPGECPAEKETVLDVKVVTAAGTAIDVEIQLYSHPALRERMTLSVARLLSSQGHRGNPYHALRPAIVVVITGFDLTRDGNDTDYRHRYLLHDPEHNVTFTNILQVHTLELPKVPPTHDGTRAWPWMRFLAANTEKELAMAAIDHPDIARAVTLVERFSADETARHEAESREKFLYDQWAREHYAREEGEQTAHHDDARRALRLGLPPEQVAEITGLSLDEIAALTEPEPN